MNCPSDLFILMEHSPVAMHLHPSSSVRPVYLSMAGAISNRILLFYVLSCDDAIDKRGAFWFLGVHGESLLKTADEVFGQWIVVIVNRHPSVSYDTKHDTP